MLIFDVNCFVGHWPFRRIPHRTVDDIRRLMARTGTEGALVTPLAGLFYKDCLSAVGEMLYEIRAGSYSNIWPVAVLNPAFPGWQEDLSIMIDEWGCLAIRLLPNYHGYRLTDPQATELLQALQGQGLPLMVSMRLEDERLQHWLLRVEPVSHLDIMWVLRAFPEIKLALCELRPDEVDQLLDHILAHPYASIVTPSRMPQFYTEEMIGQLGAERVLYGTGMPLSYPEGVLHQIRDAKLSENQKGRVLSGNALKMFALELESTETHDH